MIGKLIDFNEFGYPPVASEFNKRIELNNDYGNWMGKSQEQSNCKSQEQSNFLISFLFATSLPGVLSLATWTRKGKPTKTKKMATSRTRTLQKTPRPRLQTASGSSRGRHTRRADLSGRRSPHWGSWRAGNEAGNNHRYQIQGSVEITRHDEEWR